MNIVKDKALLKDLAHLVEFIHTTSLEVYHSLYLKYVPKLTHFSHEVMKVGTMLAALDHNFNANRPQVCYYSHYRDMVFVAYSIRRRLFRSLFPMRTFFVHIQLAVDHAKKEKNIIHCAV